VAMGEVMILVELAFGGRDGGERGRSVVWHGNAPPNFLAAIALRPGQPRAGPAYASSLAGVSCGGS